MFCTTAVFKFNCLYKTLLAISNLQKYQEHKKIPCIKLHKLYHLHAKFNIYILIGGDGYHVDSGAGDISYEQLQAIKSLVVENGYYQTAT